MEQMERIIYGVHGAGGGGGEGGGVQMGNWVHLVIEKGNSRDYIFCHAVRTMRALLSFLLDVVGEALVLSS